MNIIFDSTVESESEMLDIVSDYKSVSIVSFKEGPNGYPEVELRGNETDLRDFCESVLGDDLDAFVE